MVQSGSKISIDQMGLLPLEEILATKHNKKNISIGVPLDDNKEEFRVALTPQAVEQLTDNGHRLLIESKAGAGANYSDLNYSEYGATIANNKEAVFNCDIILKVSPLTTQEIGWLRPGQTIISAFSITTQSAQSIRLLLNKRVNAIAFEYIQGRDQHLPVVSAMSEIAGLASVSIAAEYLSNAHGGKGVLLGGISGISPTELVILGTGNAAEYAARAALGMGARVRIMCNDIYRLRTIQHNIGQPVFTSVAQPRVLAKALTTADVVIGAMDMTDKRTSVFVTHNMVQAMKPGSVIIDISIDQGGCFDTSQRTTHSQPTFTKYGVVHYGVSNIASRVARTASISLSNIFAPILLDIGQAGGIKQMLRGDVGLRRGTYAYQGILTNSHIGEHFALPSQHIDLLMAAF